MNLKLRFLVCINIVLSILGGLQALHADTSLDYLNRILKEAEGGVDKNIDRLSQGVRLLTDDPANYAIYQKLEARVRAFAMEINNNKDIISYYRFGESLLGNITDALQRVRELILGRGNTVYSKEDLDSLDSEILVQYDQILFLLESAEFNRIRVFGTFFNDKMFADVFRSEPYFNLANIDRMLDFVVSQRSFYGSKMNQLERRIDAQMTSKEDDEAFQSTILDVDYGYETSLMTKNQLLFLANILLLPMR